MKTIENKKKDVFIIRCNRYMSISLKEMIKSLRYLKLRGIYKISNLTLFSLIYLSKVNWEPDCYLVIDNKNNKIGLMDDNAYLKSDDILIGSDEDFYRIRNKYVPAYELGINTENPVFSVDLKEDDCCVMKNGESFVYKNRRFYSPNKEIYIMELDFSNIIEVRRVSKTYQSNIIYKK